MTLRTISREIAIVGAAYLIFALAKNLTDPSPVFKAVSNGWGVIRLEAALALNHESFIQQVIGRISLGVLIGLTYFYAIGMWVALIVTAAVLFLKNRAAYIQLRRTFMLTMIFAAIIFAIYPLAPPRFMPGLGMTDTVMLLGLDPAPHSDSAISYNRFAAMPSLHYAWALLVMLGAFKFGGTWIKIAGVAFQAVMFVAIIATANHYVLDALAGALLLLVALYVTRQWHRHDRNIRQWTSTKVTPIVDDIETGLLNRARRLDLPDLRHQFISGFILRDGHDIHAERTKVKPLSTVSLDPGPSLRPVGDDLRFVLR